MTFLIQTLLLLLCVKAEPPPASLPCKGQVTRQTTVKWSTLSNCTHFKTCAILSEFSNIARSVNSNCTGIHTITYSSNDIHALLAYYEHVIFCDRRCGVDHTHNWPQT